MFDSHVHSNISFDGREDMSAFCEKACAMGLKEICFCEHVEIGNIYGNGWDGRLDFEEYSRQVAAARAMYPGLKIRKGAEVGLVRGAIGETETYMRVRQLDFVIASQHIVNGREPYSDKTFFEGRGIREVVREFLEETLICLAQYENYDVVGHLSYVSIYAPQPGPVEYADYPEIFDEILKHAVKNGKGIEVNTVGYHVYGAPMAALSVLKRFRELGGEVVTIGSDAHFLAALAHAYGEAEELVRQAGFKYVCTFEDRRPLFHKI